MGVYIKGMEMPKRCGECPLSLFPHSPCWKNGGALDWENRPNWCPLVPVPEHGRLIDADALAERLGITDMDCFKCAWGNYGFCGRGGDFNDACEAIEDAPTIIPADPTDKEVE